MNTQANLVVAQSVAVDAGYIKTIETTRAAIASDVNAANKYKAAGQAVAEFYHTEAQLTEVKAQFCTDAILPALDKRHAEALAIDLPRKGSKDYAKFVSQQGEPKWTALNESKKDARATIHTYFARIVSYAFPKAKEDSVARDLVTRINQDIMALVNAIQKSEDAPFDVLAVLSGFEATLRVVNAAIPE